MLYRVPRFRQRLKWIPVANHPVWVDDPHMDIRYHVRHTSLPRPGSQRQLKELIARVMSQQLDRDKPLWEWWVIEGLDGDRFALFSKIHHCMMDGSSGSDLNDVVLAIVTGAFRRFFEHRGVDPAIELSAQELYDARAARMAVPRWGRRCDTLGSIVPAKE